jgi:uncharacterized protein YjgD (DUF1641 family)
MTAQGHSEWRAGTGGNRAARDQLLDRLGDPGTVAALNSLLDNLDTLSGLLTVVSGFLMRSPEVMDNARGALRLVRREVDADAGIVQTVPRLAKVGRQSLALTDRLADDDVLVKLAQSGLLETGFLDAMFAFADGVRQVQVEIATEPPHRRRSILRLPWMMRDYDFNRGIDFLLRLVTALGKAMSPPDHENPRGVKSRRAKGGR